MLAPATSTDAEMSSLAGRPAEIETMTEFELHSCGALGEIGALPDRGFRLREIDHRAGLHAARQRVAEADDFDGCGCGGAARPAARAA